MHFFSKINFNGIEFRTGDYISTYKDDINFYIILEIVIFTSKTLFLCQKINTVQFRDHFNAYEIDKNSLGHFSLITFEQMVGPPMTIIKTAKGNVMLRLKEYYKSIQ